MLIPQENSGKPCEGKPQARFDDKNANQNIIKLCSYILKEDTGHAPNPFHNYCTLSCCTPNHMNIKLNKDDWIAGFSTKNTGNKLIYAMRISEILCYKHYFRDSRFQCKKPKRGKDYKNLCGDNMYYFENGKWKGIKRYFHSNKESEKKDCRHPIVYISNFFYYFGENAKIVPLKFKRLIRDKHGVRTAFPQNLITSFIQWLEKNNYKPNIFYMVNRGIKKKHCRKYVKIILPYVDKILTV